MALDPGYKLCTLGAEHYDEILALWQRAGLHIRPTGRDAPSAFARQIAGGQQHVAGVRLASQSALLVGVVVLTDDGRKGWINRLAVDAAHRRRGLAEALVAEAERWFYEERGIEVWAALIEAWNAPSRAFFAHIGYGQADVVYVSKRTRADA